MTNKSSVLAALKQTDKGRLSYDKNWLRDGKIQKLLQECSSPPELRANLSRYDQHLQLHQTIQKDNSQAEDDTLSSQTADTEAAGSILPRVTPIHHAIKDEEAKWDNKAKENFEDRKRKFESHTSMLLQQAENQLLQLYFDQEKKAQQLISQAEANERLRNEELKKKHLKLKEHHKQHARLLDARLQEAHKKKKEDEEKQRKIEIEKRQRLMNLVKLQQDIHTIKDNLAKNLASCRFLQYVTDGARNSGDLMGQIQDKVNSVVQEAGDTEATDRHMQLMVDLMGNAKNVHEFVTSQIASATEKGEEEEAEKERKKQEKMKKKAAAERLKQQQSASVGAVAGPSLLLNQDDTETIYDHYKKLIGDVQKACEPLMDASNKKLKFELQKAVNLPVNAIARTSGSHLRDKLQRLCTLLSGLPVEVNGKKISVHSHPVGYHFVKDLLAKKLVKQGEEQVSSSHESAFPIAAVLVGVWSEFPDVGEMVLAHFFLKCPYLVPYYMPKVEGQSDEDYYRALGYNYESSQVEKQDKFLKRMSGLVHLYASILVTSPPRGQSQAHPHNLEHGWAWLTRIINLEPRPDITATMIHEFLSVAGHALMQAYGKQFQKLLTTLYQEFMPKVVAAKGAGGPVTRLQGFLEQCIRKGQISQPDGLLPQSFWLS